MRIISSLTILLLLLVLVGCNEEANQTKKVLNMSSAQAIESNERNPSEFDQLNEEVATLGADQVIEDKKIIEYVNANHGMTIYGEFSDLDGMISNFVISDQNGEMGPFHWKQSLLRDPIIYFEDINQDNQHDIIFINIYDHGTGIILTEAHVLSDNSGESIVVPIQDIISDNINFSGRQVFLENQLIYEASMYGDLKAYIDDWVNYKVVDGKLFGAVRIGDGRAEPYAGFLEVEYSYRDGKYDVQEIRHIADEATATQGTPLQFTIRRNF